MADPNLAEFENENNIFMDALADTEAEIASGATDEPEDDEDSGDDEETDDQDDSEDEEEVDEEEDDEDEDEEDEDEESRETKGDAKKQEIAPKKHRFTLEDGSQIEILDNASFKMKVDGKFKRVSIRELKENYNGDIKHDEMIRRSAEAEKAAQARLSEMEAEEKRVRQRTINVSKAITEGNILEALAVVAEMQDENAEQIIDKWTSGMTKFLNDFESMSPEEKAEYVRRFKLEQETKSLQAKRDELKQEEDLKRINENIEAACSEHSLSRKEFDEAFDALMAKNEKLKQSGGEPVDFGIADVVELASDYRVYENILDAAEELEVKLEPKDYDYLIQILRADEKRNGGRLPDQDYVELIKAYAQDQAKDLSRKVGAKKAKITPKSRKKKKTKEISRISDVWE